MRKQIGPPPTTNKTIHLDDLDQPLVTNTSSTTSRASKKPNRSENNVSFCNLARIPRFRPSFYVLVMCTGLFFFDQVDRFIIAATADQMEIEQGWTKTQYFSLVGSIFNAPFLLAGLGFGYASDRITNKQYIIATTLSIFSLATILTGMSTQFWQVILLRMIVAICVGATTTVGAPIIASFFPRASRGLAMGIFNMGIYVGFGVAVGPGEVLSSINWRIPWVAFGFGGLVWAIFVAMIPSSGKSYQSPSLELRNGTNQSNKNGVSQSSSSSLKEVILYLIGTPSLILLFLGSLFRNAGGYVWSFSVDRFFGDIESQSSTQIAIWMGWIPPVAGTFGAILGGWVSDRIVKNQPPWKRLLVVMTSNLLATPFVLGVLFLPAPYSYMCLLPSNIIGEMWIGITVVVVIELSPVPMRGTVIAIYFFCVRLAGFFLDVMGPLEKMIQLKWALVVMWPGNYLLSSLLFFLTLTCINRDLQRRRTMAMRLSMQAPVRVHKGNEGQIN